MQAADAALDGAEFVVQDFYKFQSDLSHRARRRPLCIVCRRAVFSGKLALVDRECSVDVPVYCRNAIAPAAGHAWVAIG
jgi:hypothetical protein